MIAFREAARGLLRYPLRSLLALLGLVVGVASITGTLALLRASHRLAMASLERWGAVDVVRLDSPEGIWRDGHWTFIGKRASLADQDLARIRSLVPGLRAASKSVQLASRSVRSGPVSRDAGVEGADANARIHAGEDRLRALLQ
jgi:ABC-type antimicrobial peptide transport system permease subunit